MVLCVTGVLVLRMPVLLSACGRFYIFDRPGEVVVICVFVGGFVRVVFCSSCDLYVFYKYYCSIFF